MATNPSLNPCTTGGLIGDLVTVGNVPGCIPTPTQVNGVNVSAVLELQSTTRGFLLPRMTDTQIAAIAVPTAGMQVYSTTSGLINTYLNGAWVVGSAIQSASGTLTVANITAMFGAPVRLVPAPPAGFINFVHRFTLNNQLTLAPLTGGDVISVQWGSTVHAGGTLVTGTIAAAIFTSAVANRFATSAGVQFTQQLTGTLSDGTDAHAGLYISNPTGAFVTGPTTGVATWTLAYSTVAVS